MARAAPAVGPRAPPDDRPAHPCCRIAALFNLNMGITTIDELRRGVKSKAYQASAGVGPPPACLPAWRGAGCPCAEGWQAHLLGSSWQLAGCRGRLPARLSAVSSPAQRMPRPLPQSWVRTKRALTKLNAGTSENTLPQARAAPGGAKPWGAKPGHRHLRHGIAAAAAAAATAACRRRLTAACRHPPRPARAGGRPHLQLPHAAPLEPQRHGRALDDPVLRGGWEGVVVGCWVRARARAGGLTGQPWWMRGREGWLAGRSPASRLARRPPPHLHPHQPPAHAGRSGRHE